MRSLMFVRPIPARGREVAADAVVDDLEAQLIRALGDAGPPRGPPPRRACARSGALRGSRSRRRSRSRAGSGRCHRRRTPQAAWSAARRRRARCSALICAAAGGGTVRESRNPLTDVLEPVPDIGQPRRDLRVARRELPRERHLDLQGDQLLLRAVVEVALDPAPLGVPDGRVPCARGGELVVVVGAPRRGDRSRARAARPGSRRGRARGRC